MKAKESPNPADRPTGTLGDLLYADRAQAVVSEQEWVELVRSVADGDQRALCELYERMHRLVYTLAVRITNSRETAEELTVDVFHDVWRRSASYDPAGGSVVGWIMNQARSRAIDRLRFEQRKKRVKRDDESPLPEGRDSAPHEAAELREQGVLLREALGALTSDERRAIETAFFSGFSYAETAARLDQPVGTIKTRIRSAFAKLRRALDDTVRPL